MNLSNPITIQPPSFVRKTGETVTPLPITFNKLDIILTDMSSNKVCLAHIGRIPSQIVLWAGDEYDAIGDYTQAQAEARLLEKLGPDLKVGLENLFPKPAAQ